jgi:CheY-specific phosphatase CheX
VASFAEIKPLLTGIAASLGLPADVLETETGPQNILDELFNIVMGLTGADWAEHGFEMDFSTPITLSGQPLPPPSPDDLAFHRLAVSDKAGLKVDILVVFSGLGRPAV